MLPDEIIAQLTGEFACREQQIQHLAALYTVCWLSNCLCITDVPGASPLTTVRQHPRLDSDRQVVNFARIFPTSPAAIHDHQRPRMHNHAASA